MLENRFDKRHNIRKVEWRNIFNVYGYNISRYAYFRISL